MCGIIGQINKEKEINKDNFILMRDTLSHRGPDDAGVLFDGDKTALGHRRLSIIDLTEKGRQPISNEDETIWIIFNGEIYNFKTIKKALTGHTFKSNTDTEVIIHAYEQWGIEKTLEKLNGMFAFCIYDKNVNKVFCARDRVGIKPLVYYYDDETLIFSSEIKAVLKSDFVKVDINKDALYDFFIYRYIAHPNTIYDRIFKLEPGVYLEFDINSFNSKKVRYWDLNQERFLKNSESEMIEKIESLIIDSVRQRLVADVEVSTFLSGGIDSSLITAIACKYNDKLRAFSIDIQPEKYSEVDHAKNVSNYLNIGFQADSVGKEEFKQYFERIMEAYDEPIADSSIIPTFLLCVHTSKYTKVALSGDGGDEVFYGYVWYKQYSSLNELFRKLLCKLRSFFKKKKTTLSSFETYRRLMYDRFSEGEIHSLFNLKDRKNENFYLYQEKISKDHINPSDVNFLDFKTFLVDDILYKVDIASMANSLEVRVPYLDYRLIELMFKLDFKLLFKNRVLKYILKRIAEKHIPKENVYRNKKGFSAPVMEWLDIDYSNHILNGEMVKDGFINEDELKKFLKNERNLGKIWQLFIFEKWYSTHFKKYEN